MTPKQTRQVEALRGLPYRHGSPYELRSFTSETIGAVALVSRDYGPAGLRMGYLETYRVGPRGGLQRLGRVIY